jgi:glycerophosphoryl diester phosphodiesterase
MLEGADGVELDVRATLDGAIVVHHDPTLDVGRGGATETKRVSELSLRDVREARSGDAQIPTLEEVLAWQDRTGAFLNVELKGDGGKPLDLARRVAQLVRGRERTLLSSFNLLIVRSLSSLLPGQKTALLVEREQLLARIFWPPAVLGTSAVHPPEALLSSGLIAKLREAGATWIGVWTVNDAERARTLAKLGVDVIITDTPGLILEGLAHSQFDNKL